MNYDKRACITINMKNFLLYSPYDCLVCSDKSQVFLSQNEHLSLDENEKIFVYPVGKTSRYSFVVDIKSSSPFYKVVSDGDATYAFLLDGLLASTYSVQSFSVNGKTCFVKTGKDKVVFSEGKIEKEIFFPCDMDEFECKKEEHIIYALCKSKNCDFLVAFNASSQKIKTFSGEKISLLEHGFCVENKTSKKEYVIDKDGLSEKSSAVYSYLSQAPTDFFSYLKEGDYHSAYRLLSLSLRENLPEPDFKKFFSRISYFFPLSESKVFALSDGKPVFYTISMDGGKITEIEN